MLEESNLLVMVFLLEGLPPEAEDYAREAFQSARVAAGQIIFKDGDPGEAPYVLRAGQIRIYRTNLDGKERILAYLGPGEVFGEMALIDDSPRSASAKAVQDTLLLALYRDAYYGLADRYPQTAHNLAKVLARRIRDMNFEVEVLSFEEAAARILHDLREQSIVQLETGSVTIRDLSILEEIVYGLR